MPKSNSRSNLKNNINNNNNRNNLDNENYNQSEIIKEEENFNENNNNNIGFNNTENYNNNNNNQDFINQSVFASNANIPTESNEQEANKKKKKFDSKSIFGELLDEQSERIKKFSPYGKFKTWKLSRIIGTKDYF